MSPKISVTIEGVTPEQIQAISRIITGGAVTQDSAAEVDSVEDVSGETDTDGLPWDARIHSGTKKKNADGRWAKRRGVDEAEYEAIKTELSNKQSAVSTVHAFVPPPVMAAVETTPTLMNQAPAVMPSVMTAPPVVQAAPQMEMVVQAAQVDFNSILARLNRAVTSGKITPEGIQSIVLATNVKTGLNAVSLADYINQPHALQEVSNQLNLWGF